MLHHFLVAVIVDYASDSSVETGNFELIHECPIARFCPPARIQLNVDGKKIPQLAKAPRKLMNIKNFSDLIVEGEKLFKPFKKRSLKIPMQMKYVEAENLLENEKPKKKIDKKFLKLKPRKIYRSPSKVQRNIFETIVVKPAASSNDITSYVRKLPSFLQSTNRRLVNLNDLMRYLNINENLL